MRQRKIPDQNDWEGYLGDLDAVYFHKLAFGRSLEELQEHFGETRSIERMDELLFVPRPVFQYYVFAFVRFLKSTKAAGDSDSASAFLALLEAREERDPGSVSEIFDDLSDAIAFVASHQDYFDADPHIYDSFEERASRVRRACRS